MFFVDFRIIAFRNHAGYFNTDETQVRNSGRLNFSQYIFPTRNAEHLKK